MKNNEKINQNRINIDLEDLSEIFLQLQKISLQGIGDASQTKDIDNLNKEYNQQLNSLLNKYKDNLFSSEDGFLLAKFISFFGTGGLLDPNKFISIRQGLVENKHKYPSLVKIDLIIKLFRGYLFNFFISYGSNYDAQIEKFYLYKVEEELGNTIIRTEIKRVIAAEKYRGRSKGIKDNPEVFLKESDDKFAITLKK
jgi:hypothetical protein